ncbi:MULTISPECIES: hypothetical protein [unclassified Paenibacillus]|uniref:hypothetical protein n=1 Tax=unclassified Paenibacillus TaxID=185978 RepID=UPI0008393BD9|nr:MULTISPECIES: hypothetical protein [unclassified Paenibacillus]NWL89342.1 hypothetical protein [Paenibacillus sp. 79R4]
MTRSAWSTRTVDSIPWQRLTTAYGRGTDIPRLIETKQYGELAHLIEHQSTLWQTTPWVLLILLGQLAEKLPEQVTTEEIALYSAVASAILIDYMNPQNTVESMEELLDEAYLWPEYEEDDEMSWEAEEPPGYEQRPFFSYYYFSYVQLREAIPVFVSIMNDNDQQAAAIRELLSMLDPEDSSD